MKGHSLTGSGFWLLVDKNGPVMPHMDSCCWVWTGPTNGDGYGQLMHEGERALAHRFASELRDGPIPDGKLVRHECDNPPCVRHFLRGSSAENTNDMVVRGRHHYKKRAHCKNEHELSEDNVYMWRGARLCRTCLRENQRKTRARKYMAVAS
jgi:hypothetical protein